jgi:3-hydroxy-9,10-secoandrosta-1,3,5(10)-triene-9,17-dione monooxygenase
MGAAMGTHKVLQQIQADASYFRTHTGEADELGRLPDETARRMREIGVIRMLQPLDRNGLQTTPGEFFEAVMELAALCGASGWVAGIVGVHPWELAVCDPKVQEEVWGTDPDTWIASPYAPMGRARPVDGGWIFNGRWQFSSGTDHCEWIFLGGLVTDESGEVGPEPRQMHFILPRVDYEIVDGSWETVGLRGTGSKDIIVKDAFIPTYRAVAFDAVMNGSASRDSGRTDPLYKMPWSAIFPPAITAAVIGICEGGVAACVDYQRGRPRVSGEALAAIGEAASEVHAARCQLLANINEMFDLACADKEIPIPLRAQGRRDQVRCSWRAVAALDQAFARCGGNSIRLSQPVQQFWRHAHAGLNHQINTPGAVYRNYVLAELGKLPTDAFV